MVVGGKDIDSAASAKQYWWWLRLLMYGSSLTLTLVI